MKALIISDDDEVIKKINDALTEYGWDTIIYRWLLKALDNVEEISPDAVIISTLDYPRHWKTFASFAQSNIGGKIPRIVLYVSEDFPADERKKADALSICGTISGCDVENISRLKHLISGTADESITSASAPQNVESETALPSVSAADTVPETAVLPVPQPVPESDSQDSFHYNETTLSDDNDTAEKTSMTEKASPAPVPLHCGMIFTNPESGAYVTGKTLSFDGTIINFVADIPDFISNLKSGDMLADVSIKTDDGFSYCSASVQQNDGKNIALLIEKNA